MWTRARCSRQQGDVSSFNSIDDFVSKTALPIVENNGSIVKPTDFTLVKVPKGTKIRKSVARPQDLGLQGHLPGGATQYEIRDFDYNIMGNWFKPMGNINNFIK